MNVDQLVAVKMEEFAMKIHNCASVHQVGLATYVLTDVSQDGMEQTVPTLVNVSTERTATMSVGIVFASQAS